MDFMDSMDSISDSLSATYPDDPLSFRPMHQVHGKCVPTQLTRALGVPVRDARIKKLLFWYFSKIAFYTGCTS